MRYFNIAWPCSRLEHYMISAASRLQGVEQLVDMGQLKDLADRLSAAGKYYALYCSPSAAAQRLQLYFKYGSKRDRGWS